LVVFVNVCCVDIKISELLHHTTGCKEYIQGGAEKRENLKSLEKHEENFETLFAPETVFYKSGNFINTQKKKNPWSESASELYRPSDRRLSVT
jgi:hypothetical protein